MTPRVTGSTYERTIACPASAVLPQSPRDEPGEPAERGTAIHEFLEKCSIDGREKALAQVPEKYREVCEIIDTDSLPTELDHEVAFAYDWQADTARELGRGIGRAYGRLEATEIPLTVDVFGVHREGESVNTCYVGDYKTGWGEVTEAKRNPQIRLGMLAACRHYGRSGGVIEILRVREGDIWRDTATMDEFDLAEEALRCHRVMMNVDVCKNDHAKGRATYINPGTHCTYCRSFDYCPAQQQLAVEVLDGNLALEVESAWAGALTEATAPEAYRKYKQAKVLLKRMKNILSAYAKDHPIDLGNGKVFGEHHKRGNEKLDGEAAYAQILRLYGRSAADAATKKTTTKKAIDEALRHVDSKDSLAARKKRVLEAIREAGGSKRTASTKVEEYKR